MKTKTILILFFTILSLNLTSAITIQENTQFKPSDTNITFIIGSSLSFDLVEVHSTYLKLDNNTIFVNPSVGSVNITIFNFTNTYKKFNETKSDSSATVSYVISNFSAGVSVLVKKNSVAWQAVISNSTGYVNFDYSGSSALFEVELGSMPTTPTITGGGGGGGSFGGGGSSGIATAIRGTSASQLWSSLEKGETIMSIKKEEIAFRELKLDVKNPATNVEITVTKLDKKPDEVKTLSNVYQYIEIEKKNIENKDINKVDITFKVKKSWLKEKKADEDGVVLNRYTTKWGRLPTSKIKSDVAYIYYKATTSGFSYFAITVKPKIEEVIEEEVIEEVEEKPEEKIIEEAKEEKKSRDWTSLLISGLVVVVLVGYFYVTRKKKKRT